MAERVQMRVYFNENNCALGAGTIDCARYYNGPFHYTADFWLPEDLPVDGKTPDQLAEISKQSFYYKNRKFR